MTHLWPQLQHTYTRISHVPGHFQFFSMLIAEKCEVVRDFCSRTALWKAVFKTVSKRVRYPESSTQSQASFASEEQNQGSRLSLVSTPKVGVAWKFCSSTIYMYTYIRNLPTLSLPIYTPKWPTAIITLYFHVGTSQVCVCVHVCVCVCVCVFMWAFSSLDPTFNGSKEHIHLMVRLQPVSLVKQPSPYDPPIATIRLYSTSQISVRVRVGFKNLHPTSS